MAPKLKQHPLSAAWPAMTEEDKEQFRKSLKQRFLDRPVVTYQDMVLDGWHLKVLCDDLGITYKIKAFRGTPEEAVHYVGALNDARRHCTAAQRLHSRTIQTNWLLEQPPYTAAVHPPSKAEVAKETKTSTTQVARSRKVAKNGTEKLNQAVVDGDISLDEAAAISDLPKREQDARVAERKAGVKPEKKAKPFDPEKCPHRDECPVREELEETRDMLETQKALLGTDAAKEQIALRQENRILRGRLDRLSRGGRVIDIDGSDEIQIPLSGRDGVFIVNEELKAELAKLYPGVDTIQTLRSIRGWNISNPKLRKTKGGILRHINAWFAKAQDKAGGNVGQRQHIAERLITEAFGSHNDRVPTRRN